MRELSTHLVIAQCGERSVAGLTGGSRKQIYARALELKDAAQP